jgi:predicted phage terminase large subunit-like protein
MNLTDFLTGSMPKRFELAWHHKLIVEHLERVALGEIKNLMVRTPPQHGKTSLIERYPAWVLSSDPTKHFCYVSYSDDIASRSSRLCRDLITSDWYQEHFPCSLTVATDTRWTLETGEEGDRRYTLFSAGINGSITGHPCDYAIIDDFVKSQSEAYSQQIRDRTWDNFTSSVETRLASDGHLIVIGTCWHCDDLMGRLLSRAQADPDAAQFTVLTLPAVNSGQDAYVWNTATGERTVLPRYKALWAKRFSASALKQRKADLGPSRWSALYMANPLQSEDALFPPESWGTYEGLKVDDLALVVTAWDAASKTGSRNDYSANVTIGRLRSGGFAVLDVWRDRVGFHELPQLALARYMALMEKFQTIPWLTVEDASAGTQLIQLFQSSFPELPLIEAKPVHSKIIRAEGVTPLTRGGLVALPKEAPWRDAFIAELANFPVGQHDDMCDAFCHALKVFGASGKEFRKPDLMLLPGPMQDPYEQELQEQLEDQEYRQDCGDLSSWDNDLRRGNW